MQVTVFLHLLWNCKCHPQPVHVCSIPKFFKRISLLQATNSGMQTGVCMPLPPPPLHTHTHTHTHKCAHAHAYTHTPHTHTHAHTHIHTHTHQWNLKWKHTKTISNGARTNRCQNACEHLTQTSTSLIPNWWSVLARNAPS